jgi:hypothetical protein
LAPVQDRIGSSSQSMAEALILGAEAVNELAASSTRRVLADRASAILTLAHERRALVRRSMIRLLAARDSDRSALPNACHDRDLHCISRVSHLSHAGPVTRSAPRALLGLTGLVDVRPWNVRSPRAR